MPTSRLIHGSDDGCTGHVDLAVDLTTNLIATCGFDGEAKVFKGYDDQHPSVFLVGETAYAIAIRGNTMYVGTDDHSVQSFNLLDGSMEAVLMRFQAPPTHITTSPDLLVAAASDFCIKTISFSTNTHNTLDGHQAPVLSVAIHPLQALVASSSCDGTCRIWQLVSSSSSTSSSSSSCIKKLSCLPRCNDVSNSQTLARLVFSPDGQHLLVACREAVQAYDTSSWQLTFKLIPDFAVAMPFSTCCVSPCHSMLASSNRDGWLCVWRLKDQKLLKMTRCEEVAGSITTGLVWSSEHHVICCQNHGHMILLDLSPLSKPIMKSSETVVPRAVKLAGNSQQAFDDLFEDDDDDLLLSAGKNHQASTQQENLGSATKGVGGKEGKREKEGKGEKKGKGEKEGKGGKEGKKEATMNLLHQEADVSDDHEGEKQKEEEEGEEKQEEEEEDEVQSDGGIPGVDIDGEEENDDDEDDDDGKERKLGSGSNAVPAIHDDDSNNDWSKKLLDLTSAATHHDDSAGGRKGERSRVVAQAPFQPSSTPLGLKSRFMVWNEVGRVQQLDEDEAGEQSISVDFHDSSTHHSLHLDNHTHQFTMACLSHHALLLASSTTISLHHFSSWGSNSQWQCVVESGEQVTALALGSSFLAIATDRLFVRLFSLAGLQLRLFCLPAPVVCMSAHADLLLTTFHEFLGSSGDQCLSYQLVDVFKGLLSSHRLPLSPNSTLSWVGFTREGTLMSVDSAGVVRMLDKHYGSLWTPVANLKELCKGPSDNYWIISAQEKPQQLRAIFCRGNSHPPTLPLPTPQILSFKLPLCEPSSEKSQLEEQYWRTELLRGNSIHRQLHDNTFDQSEDKTFMTSLKQLLIKQFAVACKAGRQERALEVASFMPDLRTISLAIRYASQRGDAVVAQKLNDLASGRRAREEEEDEEGRPSLTRVVGVSNGCHGDMAEEGIKPAKIPVSRLSRNSSRIDNEEHNNNNKNNNNNNNKNNNNNNNGNNNNNYNNKLTAKSDNAVFSSSSSSRNNEVDFLHQKTNTNNTDHNKNKKNNNNNNDNINNISSTNTVHKEDSESLRPVRAKLPKSKASADQDVGPRDVTKENKDEEEDDDDDDVTQEPDYKNADGEDEDGDDVNDDEDDGGVVENGEEEDSLDVRDAVFGSKGNSYKLLSSSSSPSFSQSCSKNPFKVAGHKQTTSSVAKGTIVFDNLPSNSNNGNKAFGRFEEVSVDKKKQKRKRLDRGVHGGSKEDEMKDGAKGGAKDGGKDKGMKRSKVDGGLSASMKLSSFFSKDSNGH